MQSTPPIPGQTGVGLYQQQQSLSQASNNGVDFAYQFGLDSLGWVNQFMQANCRCTLIRVGAQGGSSPTGVLWTPANTQISHNLGVQPQGYIAVFKDKICDIIAGTTPPTLQFMFLTISDPTANVTLLMF
jgi:hypothetical protein